MKFKTVAEYFSKIEAEASRTAMTQLLAELLTQASPEEASCICNFSLGQLDPSYKAVQFNIAQELMIRVVARVMDMQEGAVKKRLQEEGDLGTVVSKASWKASAHATVLEIDTALHRLQKVTGSGSQEAKIDTLQKLLESMTPQEAMYIVRIVLGKLRLGFSDMTLIDALFYPGWS